jgi:DNA-directed RNA polymerase specialized sigma subunit
MTELEAIAGQEPFIRYVASRNGGRAMSVDFVDLCQEGRLAVVRALRLHDAARGPLVPWLRLRITAAILDCIRAANKIRGRAGIVCGIGAGVRLVPLDEVVRHLPAKPDCIVRAIFARSLLQRLAPRERAVVQARYWDGYTLREIAATRGCGISYISQIETAALQSLRR